MKRTVGITATCLLVAGLFAGCMWKPADAIEGSQVKMNFYDPNGSPAASYISTGNSAAMTKFRMADSPKTGKTITIGSAATEDTVAEQQGQAFQVQQQAYLQGSMAAMQLIGAIMGKQYTPGTAALSSWQPTIGTSPPALTGETATERPSGDVAAMLAACDTPEEQQAVLKALGLLPKTKAVKATVKKAPATTQPTTQPVK
jgi:hypothetical protein